MDTDAGLVTTGVLAQSPAQFESLWAIREGIPEAAGKEGKTYKYDVSIPVSKFKEIVDKTKEHLRSEGLLHENAVKSVIGYGHFGDGTGVLSQHGLICLICFCSGNIHLNIVAAAYTPEITAALEPFVFELVGEYFCTQHMSDTI